MSKDRLNVNIKTKFLAFMTVVLLLFFTGCYQENSTPALSPDIYRLEDYENNEVFDIEKVSLDKKLAQKCITYKFSYLSDGYEIKAYVSIPVFAVESRKPQKCLMFNRGGNAAIGGLSDTTTASISAECNRIVIASQYRGGGSDGVDEFGGDDVNDVIKLIDLCQNHFKFIDMEDFCVAGVSRGGMMTYMAARRDSRIKRIISVSGLSDLARSYEEREDTRDMLNRYIGCTPWEDPSQYEKRSAICWYDEIQIPVLIIHSTGDEQVSYKQAEELYEKMKYTTDCTLVTHKDSIHGLHSDDIKTINEWLNKK